MIRLDLGELVLDRRVIGWETAETGEGSCGSFRAAGTYEVAGCFGEDEHAGNEDEGPGELDGDGDSVRTSIVALVGCVVYDGCEEETDLSVVLAGVEGMDLKIEKSLRDESTELDSQCAK
jgi:hypothetical protein